MSSPASGPSFAPEAERLEQVLHMLHCALSSDNALQRQAVSALSEHSVHPEFVLYLAHIFVSPEAAAAPCSSASPTTAHEAVQHIAGLTLKRAIDKGWFSMEQGLREQVGAVLLDALSSPVPFLRGTAANALAAAARAAGIWSIPSLPGHIVSALDYGSDGFAGRGALQAIAMLAEDTAEEWMRGPPPPPGSAAGGVGGEGGGGGEDAGPGPINAIVPLLSAKWMTAPDPADKRLACSAMLEFMHQCGHDLPTEAWGEYMASLAALTSEDSPLVKEVLLRSFAVILVMRFEVVGDAANPMIEYALTALSDEDDLVLKAACEFWRPLLGALGTADSAAHKRTLQDAEKKRIQPPEFQPTCMNILRPYLPSLVLALVARMVWTDEGLADLPPNELEDTGAEDRPEDIRPYLLLEGPGGTKTSTLADGISYSTAAAAEDGPAAAGSGVGGSATGSSRGEDGEGGGAEEEAAQEDGDFAGGVKAYSVREEAARALDSLAIVFPVEVLEHLLPELERRLGLSASSGGGNEDGDEAWRERELVVFALGVVSDGCQEQLEEHLVSLFPYLFSLLKDPCPLVRAVTIWAFGRFSGYVLSQHLDPDRDPSSADELEMMVEGICELLRDSNRRVQQYACKALSELGQECGDQIAEYGEPILLSIIDALPSYRKRSRMLMLDVIGSLTDNLVLSDALSDRINHSPPLADRLLDILMTIFMSCTLASPELLPLLNCFHQFGPSMGADFAPACQPIFEVAMDALTQDLTAALAAVEANEPVHDCRYAAMAFDTVTCIIESIGAPAAAEFLVPGKYDIVSLIVEALPILDPGLQQSIFVLVGTLCEEEQTWALIAAHSPTLAQAAIAAASVWLNEEEEAATVAGTGGKGGGHSSSAGGGLSSSGSSAWLKVANNAVWTLGNMARLVGPGIAEAVPAILPLALSIFKSKFYNPILLANASHLVGQLCSQAAPTVVTLGEGGSTDPGKGMWPVWAPGWLRGLSCMQSRSEREGAVAGLCAAIEAAPDCPEALVTHFAMAFCAALIPPDSDSSSLPSYLVSRVGMILSNYRDALGPAAWQRITSTWTKALVTDVQTVFGVLW
jgi:transportin-1